MAAPRAPPMRKLKGKPTPFARPAKAFDKTRFLSNFHVTYFLKLFHSVNRFCGTVIFLTDQYLIDFVNS
jgi:hypothetical protein